MKLTRSLVGLAFFGVTGLCIAQGTPEDPSKNTGAAGQGDAMTGDAMWDDLDSNKDGFLTKDELTGSPALVTHFKEIDTNGDGKISPEEWKGYGHKDRKE
jgi:hypothetical protein